VLTAYRTQTRNLLQSPSSASTLLYADADLDTWINIARGQLAGEGECIRVIGTVSTTIGQRAYNFSALNLGAGNGVQGAIHVRRITYVIGGGEQWIAPRPWPWFEYYGLNNVVPTPGPPTSWSQYGQGSAGTGTGSGSSGSFYLDPPPDVVYALNCDCVCYPAVLVDDTTVEAIPYLWTDAVPYYAAYLAFLSSQTSARQADAERMFNHYETFVERARKAANTSVLRWQYEQSSDIAQAAKFGVQAGGGK
jgi:hypothetical protein